MEIWSDYYTYTLKAHKIKPESILHPLNGIASWEHPGHVQEASPNQINLSHQAFHPFAFCTRHSAISKLHFNHSSQEPENPHTKGILNSSRRSLGRRWPFHRRNQSRTLIHQVGVVLVTTGCDSWAALGGARALDHRSGTIKSAFLQSRPRRPQYPQGVCSSDLIRRWRQF